MASFNKVLLIGNLTRDPELRYTPKGTAVAKIGLAVNRSWRDPETNEQREEVTFIDVTAFGRQAETIGQYLRKGRPLHVEGRLKLDQWEDKQTHEKKSKLGVVMESFQFLDYKKDEDGDAPPAKQGGGRGQGNNPAYQPGQTAKQNARSAGRDSTVQNHPNYDGGSEIPPEDDDDLPF